MMMKMMTVKKKLKQLQKNNSREITNKDFSSQEDKNLNKETKNHNNRIINMSNMVENQTGNKEIKEVKEVKEDNVVDMDMEENHKVNSTNLMEEETSIKIKTTNLTRINHSIREDLKEEDMEVKSLVTKTLTRTNSKNIDPATIK